MNTGFRYIGTAAALIFIGFILVRGASDMPAVNLRSGSVWLALAGGYLLYVLSQIIGGSAWRATLAIYDTRLPGARAESQLLVSQIGKYIPGNVAHFIGRIGLARADGIQASVIAGSLILEIGFLVSAGILVVGAMLLIIPDLIAALTADLALSISSGPLVFVFFGVLACIGIGQYLIWHRAGKPKLILGRFVLPVVLFGGNFLVLGFSLWCVVQAVYPPGAISILHCVAIFTTAWVAGFLMPGAPGGVGVRDGIVAVGLEIFIGPGAGLSAAVVHRVISVFGDVTTFGIGMMLRRK